MCRFLILRHGPTQWNQEKRLQGRTDIPLLPDAEKDYQALSLPNAYRDWPLYSSPLIRARQTAEFLTRKKPILEDLLIEMNFGLWEGHSLKALRSENPDMMREQEDRGWHMTPPNGESPAMVKDRLAPLAQLQKQADKDRVYIAHKGIIRVFMAWATGWDFMGNPPIDLDYSCCHLFEWLTNESPRLIDANIPLKRNDQG